jgi:hypothetical protein
MDGNVVEVLAPVDFLTPLMGEAEERIPSLEFAWDPRGFVRQRVDEIGRVQLFPHPVEVPGATRMK